MFPLHSYRVIINLLNNLKTLFAYLALKLELQTCVWTIWPFSDTETRFFSIFTECTKTTCYLDSPNGEMRHLERSFGQKPENRWSLVDVTLSGEHWKCLTASNINVDIVVSEDRYIFWPGRTHICWDTERKVPGKYLHQLTKCAKVQQTERTVQTRWKAKGHLYAPLQGRLDMTLRQSQGYYGGVSPANIFGQNIVHGQVVRVPGYRSRSPGSIPGATRLSEKVWNGGHSASWVQLRSYLEEKVAAPV
jgi:hypothetical protein